MKLFRLFILFLLVFGLLFLATAALGKSEIPAANTSDTDGGSPVLDATTKATHRYLPVKFDSHDKHSTELGISCKRCHHEIADGVQEPSACSNCHDKKDSKPNMTEAMHQSCRGCHQQAKKKTPKSKVPTRCLDCHTERK